MEVTAWPHLKFANHKQRNDAYLQIDGHCEHGGVWHDQLATSCNHTTLTVPLVESEALLSRLLAPAKLAGVAVAKKRVHRQGPVTI